MNLEKPENFLCVFNVALVSVEVSLPFFLRFLIMNFEVFVAAVDDELTLLALDVKVLVDLWVENVTVHILKLREGIPLVSLTSQPRQRL